MNQLGPGQFERVAKALADPRRFEMLSTIASKHEVACRLLVDRFPVAQATISHHLKELLGAGLVDERREAQAKFYRLRRDTLEAYQSELRRRLMRL
jgi:ArsR family transcriptional regulator, arsenate/arsenite/antimonite-responsive transcriptional repressor